MKTTIRTKTFPTASGSVTVSMVWLKRERGDDFRAKRAFDESDFERFLTDPVRNPQPPRSRERFSNS